MRKIKFRSWLKNQKKMIYPYVLDFLHNTWVADKDLYGSFDEIEFMQFTGLCDKNGKEIYEGDIVLFDDKNYIVKYFNQYSRFGLSSNNEMDKLPMLLTSLSNVEVIGNFYERRK